MDQVTSSPCFTCVDSLSLYELKQKASKSLECYLPLARDENGAVATSSLEKDMGLRAGTTSFARRGVPRRGEVERAHRDERALHRGSRPSPSSLGGRTPDLVSGKSPSPVDGGGPASDDAGPVAQSPSPSNGGGPASDDAGPVAQSPSPVHGGGPASDDAGPVAQSPSPVYGGGPASDDAGPSPSPARGEGKPQPIPAAIPFLEALLPDPSPPVLSALGGDVEQGQDLTEDEQDLPSDDGISYHGLDYDRDQVHDHEDAYYDNVVNERPAPCAARLEDHDHLQELLREKDPERDGKVNQLNLEDVPCRSLVNLHQDEHHHGGMACGHVFPVKECKAMNDIEILADNHKRTSRSRELSERNLKDVTMTLRTQDTDMWSIPLASHLAPLLKDVDDDATISPSPGTPPLTW